MGHSDSPLNSFIKETGETDNNGVEKGVDPYLLHGLVARL